VTHDADEFLEQSRRKRSSLAHELYQLLRHNKRWWLTPIIIVMLLLGLLSLFAGSSVAPFIYTLF
jgi:fluoride ion exporter CrcB/FEX